MSTQNNSTHNATTAATAATAAAAATTAATTAALSKKRTQTHRTATDLSPALNKQKVKKQKVVGEMVSDQARNQARRSTQTFSTVTVVPKKQVAFPPAGTGSDKNYFGVDPIVPGKKNSPHFWEIFDALALQKYLHQHDIAQESVQTITSAVKLSKDVVRSIA